MVSAAEPDALGFVIEQSSQLSSVALHGADRRRAVAFDQILVELQVDCIPSRKSRHHSPAYADGGCRLQAWTRAYESFLLVYQADLASIGVKLNIKPVQTAAFVHSAQNPTYNGLAASADVEANLNPATMLSLAPAWRVFPNNSGFDTREWKDMVTRPAPGCP